jgi:arylsulfatase A-like enzyme
VLPVPGDIEGYLDAEARRDLLALYAGVITFVDACVGRLLEELKRLDLYDRSLILILTDHGEPFGEHGIVRKVRPWPYEELAHTWLAIRHPGGKGVKRVHSYVQQTDITATILEYAGIRPPRQMTSESLLPLVLGQKEKIRDSAVCCHHTGGWSIRHDDWSYHYYLPGNARAAKKSKLTKSEPELYNLRADPAEKNNLARAEPERARQMDQMLFEFTKRLKEAG